MGSLGPFTGHPPTAAPARKTRFIQLKSRPPSALKGKQVGTSACKSSLRAVVWVRVHICFDLDGV